MRKIISISIMILLVCLSINFVSASLTYNKQAIEQWLLDKKDYNTTVQLNNWYFGGDHTYNGNLNFTGTVSFVIPPWGTSINGTSVTFTGISNLGNGSYQWNFSDGYSYTTANLSGVKGDQGIQGIQGIQGVAGVNGNNGTNGLNITVSSISDLGNGSINFSFSDGYNYITRNLSGVKGDTGAQGIQGIQGISGTNGTNGINGINGTDGINGSNASVDLSGYAKSLTCAAGYVTQNTTNTTAQCVLDKYNTSSEIMNTIINNNSLYNRSNPNAYINISNLTNYQNCSINNSCKNVMYYNTLESNYTLLVANLTTYRSTDGTYSSYCSSGTGACYIYSTVNLTPYFGNGTAIIAFQNRGILALNGSCAGRIYLVGAVETQVLGGDYVWKIYFQDKPAGIDNRPTCFSTQKSTSFSVIEFKNITTNGTMITGTQLYSRFAYIENLKTKNALDVPQVTTYALLTNMSTKYGGYGSTLGLGYWTMAIKDIWTASYSSSFSITGILNSNSNIDYTMTNLDVSSLYGDYNTTTQYYYWSRNAVFTAYLGGYYNNYQDIDNVTNVELRMRTKNNKLTNVFVNMKNLDIRNVELTGVSYLNNYGIIISNYINANDTAIKIQGNSKSYLGDANSNVWFNNSYIQNDGNVTYFVTNASGLNGNTSGFAYFSGSVSATEYRTRTEVNNDSNVLDSLMLGSELLTKEGKVNHTAFGNCYRSNEITDYARPVKIYHNYNYVENFRNETTGLEYNETRNGTQEEITYPYKIMTQEEDLVCMNAKHEQALATYHQASDVQQIVNSSPIFVTQNGLATESLYMMSTAKDFKNKTDRDIMKSASKQHLMNNGSVNYSSYGDNYKKLGFKDYINGTLIITQKNAVDIIGRMDDMEAQIAVMSKALCVESKNAYSWC